LLPKLSNPSTVNFYQPTMLIYKGKKVKVKVKQSHYRSGQALRVPGG
jgi:hypothetical protein